MSGPAFSNASIIRAKSFGHQISWMLPSGITAFLQMNNPNELIGLSKTPDPGLYRHLLAESLVTLIDRGALTQVADLNELAEADLAKLRRETGIGVETLPPPPLKPPTAEELLRDEIASDWRSFTTLMSDYLNLSGTRVYLLSCA
jgi:hypothetical protein